jgi:hypothetical protein
MALTKIISGGQTGVDRAALDAASAVGFPCGGWCPADRKAEDGPIPERYPMSLLTERGYRLRTLKNVQTSDGTAILFNQTLSGGTKLTRDMGSPQGCDLAMSRSSSGCKSRPGSR